MGRLVDSETGGLSCEDKVEGDGNFSYSYDLIAGRTYYIGVLLTWDDANATHQLFAVHFLDNMLALQYNLKNCSKWNKRRW